ncbi:MAG: cytidylate kinase-like family protein [Treponema sp.]|nr:cytidylate kinase-like family protein [Treponema sp.]
MKKIITIGREYCSGGSIIGKLLAEKLGYAFYDKQIIDDAAQNSGLSADFITKNEQKVPSAWLYSILVGATYAAPGTNGAAAGISTGTLPLADQVFNAQRSAIIELAKKGPCVIVGRCSDYILRHCEEIDRSQLLNVFIYAPMEAKVRRAIEQKKLDEKNAERNIKLIDKGRANHYNTFTQRTWGNRTHYDILLNSSTLGLEKTADLLAQMVKESQAD